jgi:hypothetical protein
MEDGGAEEKGLGDKMPRKVNTLKGGQEIELMEI